MIKKRHRGISSGEINQFFREGNRDRLSGGFLCYRPKKGTYARLAVSVSKKAARGAVHRAKIRRKIQAAADPLVNATAQYDHVLVWTRTTAPNVEQLTKEFIRAVRER